MDYESKKSEILKDTSEFLKVYDEFYKSALNLERKIGNLDATFAEKMDFKMTIANNDDMKKFSRLILALLYVEEPTIKEFVSALIENIKDNNTLNEEKPETTVQKNIGSWFKTYKKGE